MSKAREDIDRQAAWQRDRYGDMNETMPDGTGGGVEWLKPVVDVAQSAYTGDFGANVIEEIFRAEWDYPAHGTPEQQDEAAAACSWLRILREEVAEAFASADVERLRAELVQVSAVAQNWVETIDRRNDSGTA